MFQKSTFVYGYWFEKSLPLKPQPNVHIRRTLKTQLSYFFHLTLHYLKYKLIQYKIIILNKSPSNIATCTFFLKWNESRWWIVVDRHQQTDELQNPLQNNNEKNSFKLCDWKWKGEKYLGCSESKYTKYYQLIQVAN